MKELFSNLYRKLGAATKEWIAEREADQRRLDWLDHDGTKIGKVAELVTSHCSVREAIDELMTRDATPPEET